MCADIFIFVDLDESSFSFSGSIESGNESKAPCANLADCQINQMIPEEKKLSRKKDSVLFFRIVRKVEQRIRKMETYGGLK